MELTCKLTYKLVRIYFILKLYIYEEGSVYLNFSKNLLIQNRFCHEFTKKINLSPI
jgi:hypothetical protein